MPVLLVTGMSGTGKSIVLLGLRPEPGQVLCAVRRRRAAQRATAEIDTGAVVDEVVDALERIALSISDNGDRNGCPTLAAVVLSKDDAQKH